MKPRSRYTAVLRNISIAWTDLRLRQKGLVVVAIPSIAIVAATVCFYWILRVDRQADVFVEQTTEGVRCTQRCLTHLLTAEFAVHQYRSDGQPKSLVGLILASQSLDEEIGHLEVLLRVEPAQRAPLRRTRELYERTAALWGQLPLPAGRRAEVLDRCQANTDGLRLAIREVYYQQEKLLTARVARLDPVRAQVGEAIAVNALLGLFGGVLVIVLFTSGIAQRIERLQKNVARMENRQPLAPRRRGRDEIGILEEAFERANASLRQSEEERERLFTVSLDILCVITLDGRLRRVNPAFAKILGYPEDGLLGRAILCLAHRDDREAIAAEMQQLACGTPIAYMEKRFMCADGSQRWLAWSMAPYLAEGKAYAVARDRTRQKEDEQALRESHGRLSSMLESTTDAFFAADRSWKVITVNRQGERLWGLTREQILGHNLWELFPEAVDGPFYRMYRQVMETGTPAHLEDFYAPMQSWFEVHAYPSPEGIAVYFRNVTDRRQSEERIQRALREKEVLLREIHHRVKNNLQVICSMLRLQAGAIHDMQLSLVLRECRERVMAMAMLHDQLHRAKNLAQIDLGEYLRNLASSIFCSYGVDSAQIELQMDVEDVTVTMDTAIPCGLIVHELLSNSLRHAFPEGRTGHVWLTLRTRPEAQIELAERDDGCGFSEEAFANTRSLGLRLVDLFAQQIEAAVERSTKPGSLCRLIFQLPKAKETEL